MLNGHLDIDSECDMDDPVGYWDSDSHRSVVYCCAKEVEEMSILIKGMEMPKNCDVCPFIFYDANIMNERAWCEAVKPYGIDVTDFQEKRHSNCPLIELPPHGRLIDADALMENEENISFKDEWHMTVTEAFVSVENIANAPTIIEAEVNPISEESLRKVKANE